MFILNLPSPSPSPLSVLVLQIQTIEYDAILSSVALFLIRQIVFWILQNHINLAHEEAGSSLFVVQDWSWYRQTSIGKVLLYKKKRIL